MRPKGSKKNNYHGLNSKTKDGNAEVFVLPPNLLQKLGINLGNIHQEYQTDDNIGIEENVAGYHQEVDISSVKNGSISLSVLKKSVNESTILETAALMKKSVFLSPTFVANGSGELEIANIIQSPKNENTATEHFENRKIDVVVDSAEIKNMPAISHAIIDQRQNSTQDYNSNDDVDNLNTNDGNCVSHINESELITLVDILGEPTKLPNIDDHPDEAYSSDCSNSNQGSLDIDGPFNDIPEINYYPLSNGKKDKIEIISEEILSPFQLKEIKKLHLPMTSNILTVPATKNCMEKYYSFAHDGNVDQLKYTDVDAEKLNLKTVLLFDENGKNIPVDSNDGNLRTEFLSNISDCNVEKTVEEVPQVDGDNVKNGITNELQNNLGVCIDFIATDIERHLKDGENEEILESFVKEITSNDNNGILKKIEESEKDSPIKNKSDEIKILESHLNLDIVNNQASIKVHNSQNVKILEVLESMVTMNDNSSTTSFLEKQTRENIEEMKAVTNNATNQFPADIISVVLETDVELLRPEDSSLTQHFVLNNTNQTLNVDVEDDGKFETFNSVEDHLKSCHDQSKVKKQNQFGMEGLVNNLSISEISSEFCVQIKKAHGHEEYFSNTMEENCTDNKSHYKTNTTNLSEYKEGELNDNVVIVKSKTRVADQLHNIKNYKDDNQVDENSLRANTDLSEKEKNMNFDTKDQLLENIESHTKSKLQCKEIGNNHVNTIIKTVGSPSEKNKSLSDSNRSVNTNNKDQLLKTIENSNIYMTQIGSQNISSVTHINSGQLHITQTAIGGKAYVKTKEHEDMNTIKYPSPIDIRGKKNENKNYFEVQKQSCHDVQSYTKIDKILDGCHSNVYTDKVKEIAELLTKFAKKRASIGSTKKMAGNSVKILKKQSQQNILKNKMHKQGVEKPGGTHDTKTKSSLLVTKTYNKISKPKQRISVEILPKTLTIKIQESQINLNDKLQEDTCVDANILKINRSPTFCLCGDYGRLANYESNIPYEHIHFWDHKNIVCNRETLFDIFYDRQCEKINMEKEPLLQEDQEDKVIATSANNICWYSFELHTEISCENLDKEPIMSKEISAKSLEVQDITKEPSIIGATSSDTVKIQGPVADTNAQYESSMNKKVVKIPDNHEVKQSYIQRPSQDAENSENSDGIARKDSPNSKNVAQQTFIKEPEESKNKSQSRINTNTSQNREKPVKIFAENELLPQRNKGKLTYDRMLSESANKFDSPKQKKNTKENSNEPKHSSRKIIVQVMDDHLVIRNINDSQLPANSDNYSDKKTNREFAAQSMKIQNVGEGSDIELAKQSLNKLQVTNYIDTSKDKDTSSETPTEPLCKRKRDSAKCESEVTKHKKKVKTSASELIATETASALDKGNTEEVITKKAKNLELKKKDDSLALGNIKINNNKKTKKVPRDYLKGEEKVYNKKTKSQSLDVPNVEESVTSTSNDNMCNVVENVNRETTSEPNVCTGVKRKRSVSENESLENAEPPSKKSVVICGVCNSTQSESEWEKHVEEEHCFIAWKLGGEIDLNDLEFKKKLHVKARTTKTLKCTFCGNINKNSKNFLVHIQECLKSNSKNTKQTTEDNSENVSCGTCKEVVAVSNWIEHIAHNHEYVAWKSGEESLDVEDEKSIQQYLNSLSKKIGGLVCYKCGWRRKYAIPYQQHVKYCKGQKPKGRESIDTTSDTLMDETVKSEIDEKDTPTAQNSGVTCGVCKQTVERSYWIKHISENHEYVAWKDGKDPINTEDSSAVQRYLNDLSREINGLVCHKCGLKRKYAIPYQQHVKACAGTKNLENVYRAAGTKDLDSSTKNSISIETVKCGVCHEEVEVTWWTQHILKAHQYLAWKDGETIDFNDQEQLERHLTLILKHDFYLMCNKCGSLYRNTVDYLQHVNSCTADPGKFKKSEKKVTCAICYKEIDLDKWDRHKMQMHYNAAWKVGHPPLDVKHQNTVFTIMEGYKQEYQKFKCRECGASRGSGVGFYSHIIGCGKTEEELELHRTECELCKKKYFFFYHSQHMTWHATKIRKEAVKLDEAPDESKIPEKEEELGLPLGRRKAAQKAQTIIEKIKEGAQFAHTCSHCNFGSESSEELKNHVCEDGDSDSDKSCKLDEDSDDESVDTDVDSNVSEEEEADRTYSRRLKAPVSHRIKRFPLQSVDVTNFMKKSAWDFYNEHLSMKNLFPDYRNFVLEAVLDGQLSKYIPPLEESCKVLSEGTWETYKRFKAKKVNTTLANGKKSATQRLFAGGYVQCLAWAPGSSEENNTGNFLAVASYPGNDCPYYKADEIITHPSLIQIWDFGKFTETSKFVLGIAHDFGHVWSMCWCPAGANDVAPEDSDKDIKRLGLLAIACSNGSAYIIPVPYPSSVPQKDNPIFKLKPAVELRVTSGPDRKRYQATCISWSKQKGYGNVVVGYSDGTVAYYDLETESPLLKSKEDDVTILLPFHDERFHNACVTGIDWYPSTEGAPVSGLLCCSAMTGASLVGRPTQQQFRQHMYGAIGDVTFQPFWPAVNLTGDDAYITTATDEIELGGAGRRWGGGTVYAGCWHCGRFVLAIAPLIRTDIAHPAYCKYKKRRETFAVCKLKPFTTKHKKTKNDELQVVVEPNTYEEAVLKYGLEFRMDKASLESSYGIKGENYPEKCPTRFPLNEVTSMAFCTSAKFHKHLAVATHSGVIFLVAA